MSNNINEERTQSSSQLQTHTAIPGNPQADAASQEQIAASTPTAPPKTKAELETISEINQVMSPFLRLPGEVRNRIYHYAFGGHEIYAMPSGLRPFVCMGRPDDQFAWNLQPIAQIMALHLPLVCRQIRSETGKYFAFKFNSFGSTMPEYFKLMLASLTVEQKRRIEVVRINHVVSSNRVIIVGSETAALAGYAGLTELRNLRLVVLRDLGDMRFWEREVAVEAFRRIAGKPDLKVEIESIC